MVKNAKRRVKAKAGKRTAGRVKAKAKRAAKAKAKVMRKRTNAKRVPPIQAQAVGSLVVGTALDVAEAVGDAPVEQVAMDCASGLEPDQEIAQLDALDDADRAADEGADEINGAGI